jgi:integrase
VAKGSIRQRGNKYQITFDIGIDPATGKRRRHYASFTNERDAQLALAQISAQIDNGTYIDETTDTVQAFVADWLAKTSRHLRPNTLYVYQRYLALLEPFLPKMKAKDLRKVHVEELFNALLERYKPSTVAVCKRLLSTAFARGVEWELITKNPFKGVSIPQEKSDYVVWTPAEANRFLDAARYSCEYNGGNWSYYLAYVIAIRTGMRKSEILGLRWSNVDIDNRAIYVRESLHELYGKGEKYVGGPKSKAGLRVITIDDELADELRRHAKRGPTLPPAPPNDYVITTIDGQRPIHPRNLTKAMVKIIDAEKLQRLRFHDLRHTHASLLLSTGISPKIIQERLGHAKLSTTMDTYSHVLPSMQREAADKISELLSANTSAASTTVR